VLRVGCAMWAYKAWQGRHFPEHLARGEQLPTYATWCNAVEGNTTFYGVPSERTVRAWAAEVPPTFRFVFKLPRAVTHDHRLRDVTAEMREFLGRIEPLGERAEQLSVQLPPSFGPDDLGVLARFVRRLPAAHRFAVELRHRAFYEQPEVEAAAEELLAGHGIEWIDMDTTTLFASATATDAEHAARRQKPQLPRRVRALTDHPVVRYVGVDDAERTAAGWRPWLAVLAGWLDEGRVPSVFVHTPDNLDAPVLARRLHAEVGALRPGLPPLPDPAGAAPGGTPTLF
jgi:uncharacterized protein YecE (DUF72 family)